jgi:hypothetical protein
MLLSSPNPFGLCRDRAGFLFLINPSKNRQTLEIPILILDKSIYFDIYNAINPRTLGLIG